VSPEVEIGMNIDSPVWIRLSERERERERKRERENVRAFGKCQTSNNADLVKINDSFAPSICFQQRLPAN